MVISPPQLDRGDEQPLYRQVETYLEDLIRGGGLKPGEPIPSLNALVATLGVNNLTIRRGIAELVQRGLLVSRQGRGTFVAQGALPRVLWVSGVDITSGDVSSYYLELLRFGARQLRTQGLLVDAIWMAHSDKHHRYLDPQPLKSYSGFIFSGCRDSHLLLRQVAVSGAPFCDLSFSEWPNQPRRCTPDVLQADRAARAELVSQNCRRITVMSLFPTTQREKQVWQGLEMRYIACDSRTSSRTLAERAGYRVMRQLLEQGDLGDGLYITDDLIACGATRAMLERGQTGGIELVVRCARQQVVPLGLPARFVVFDLQEQAERGVGLLIDQLQGSAGAEGAHHVCSYAMLNPQLVEDLVLSH